MAIKYIHTYIYYIHILATRLTYTTVYTVSIRYKPVNHKRALTPSPRLQGRHTHPPFAMAAEHVSVINISVFADEVEHGPSTPSPLWLRINFLSFLFYLFLFLSLFIFASFGPHPTPTPGEFSAYILYIIHMKK